MKKKLIKRNWLFPLMVVTIPSLGFAQEESILYNTGELFVKNGTSVTTLYNFENAIEGSVYNNGNMFFLANYLNDGNFHFLESNGQGFRSNALNGKGGVTFEKENGKQKISGKGVSSFNDVSIKTTAGVDLENSISIVGITRFERGNLIVNEQLGSVTFLEDATIAQVSDNSHVVGVVEREGKKELELPIGDGNHYRPVVLGNAKGGKDLYSGEYKYENPLDKYPFDTGKKEWIKEVDDKEYWIINKSKSKNTSDDNIIITLSWNEITTPKTIYEYAEEDLHVLRWDADLYKWIDEGGIVDVGSKMVTTAAKVSNYGIFTLGTVKDKLENLGVVIYNAVSPNGDGHNDYFLIENISDYQNNVQIYNRWSTKVFEIDNYGEGDNVFKGEAHGRGVSAKGKLPSGTYFYVVKYEYKDEFGSRWIKKTGYLHLEND